MESHLSADRRIEILARYQARARGFDELAARRAGRGFSLRPLPSQADGPRPSLSTREIHVLTHVARGLSNKEIAAVLVLSEDTVKTHVRRLLTKLEAKNRAHAVTIGYEAGLIELHPPPRAA